MTENIVPSDRPVIHGTTSLAPPTFWDLFHRIAVRDSAPKGTIEGILEAKELVKLLGPQRVGMAAHPSLPALCAFAQERWGPKPPPAHWIPWRRGEVWVGLDKQICLDLQSLLCQNLGLRPSEADRLPLSDVVAHFCPVVPPAPPAQVRLPLPDWMGENFREGQYKLLKVLWGRREGPVSEVSLAVYGVRSGKETELDRTKDRANKKLAELAIEFEVKARRTAV